MSSEPPFRFKTTLLPKLNMNPNCLKFKTEDETTSFAFAHELAAKYQERVSSIQKIKDMRCRRKETRDSADKQEIDESLNLLKLQRTNSRNKVSGIADQEQRLVKVQQMFNYCEGLEDFDCACFYLEAQQWDLEKAVTFYCDSTGSMDIRKESRIRIKFIMPDETRITREFERHQLLWSMLPVIYETIPNDRQIVVKLGKRGEPITEETMTAMTYKKYGISSSATLYVEYS